MSKFVEIKFKNQVLEINSRGGGIARYYIEDNIHGIHSRKGHGKERIDIVCGYESEKEYDSGMGEILSPFPGRVDKGKFQFEGKNYQLKNVKLNKGNPLHELVRNESWQVKKTAENKIEATFQLKASKFGSKGFPFSLNYLVKYQLSSFGLTIITEVKNVGPENAPFGLGFHPYFAVAPKVNEMIWQVPAKKLVEFSPDLKPTGKLLEIGKTNLDFRKSQKIGNRIIDNCFYNLIRDGKGIFKSTLKNEAGTKEITIWQDENYPYFQTYSSDTIALRNRRRAMALEPQTCSGFAVNYPKLGLITLKPGQRFKGKWGINFKIIF